MSMSSSHDQPQAFTFGPAPIQLAKWPPGPVGIRLNLSSVPAKKRGETRTQVEEYLSDIGFVQDRSGTFWMDSDCASPLTAWAHAEYLAQLEPGMEVSMQRRSEVMGVWDMFKSDNGVSIVNGHEKLPSPAPQDAETAGSDTFSYKAWTLLSLSPWVESIVQSLIPGTREEEA
ncbi:hypothetical protein PLICRDRAFT_46642 [Plicaturopsis crispa FD-325 SS-3]|uniref:Uncharacterized protein n=1 Tax=Plicaturopsis crispa FD-325 SS-3 TaxID=944288 RepID=A0A0C9T3K0_PLICR|nr:hypothetical protein PLICRDRAFT_46642 [Plicaturopsis crispa FD-325 SS-3]